MWETCLYYCRSTGRSTRRYYNIMCSCLLVLTSKTTGRLSVPRSPRLIPYIMTIFWGCRNELTPYFVNPRCDEAQHEQAEYVTCGRLESKDSSDFLSKQSK
jgi:hypothetical protein